MSGDDRRRRRRTGPAVVGVVAVLAIGAGAAAATGTGLPRRETSGQTHSDLPPATAKVTRQTLVDTQTESGDLGYGDDSTLSGRLGGTVTALPAAGATLARGQAAYRVDNTPVVLLYGSLPAYRALALGTKGADVKQFERNLYALGYRGFTVDDTYSAATVAAVKQWQGKLGLPKSGVVELGRVIYTAGPVRVDARKAALGDQAQPGGAVLTYTGTSRMVTVELEVTDERLAVKGAAVTVELPDGKTVAGKIVDTQTVIEPASGNEAASTKIKVSVTVDDDKALAGLNQAIMNVDFTASRRENVLTVPVTSLLALAEGGYGVQVVEGGTTKVVAVQTGLFASGRVEVTGEGLTEGMTVGIPS
ncbi:efflux RND transporter periplasmic adaptor subunit [Rugosimonospora africana]|uniref:Peptidoglycan-binding protein n=1 Tax=Rugosimonospora africana TaxID=556532 RepID=A0A8J3QYC9_9ACTN|nr:peptidoglycan-binding protein [Rugosimonospora africana]GIH19143.1 peptidoglycan-binding protein [Rugosimonospora africana]